MKNILSRLNFSFFKKVPIVLQSEISECSLACLCMILNYYGNNKDLFYLRNLCKLSSKGLNLEHLQIIVEKLNFDSRALSLELTELHLLKKPCIIHWNFNHFVVLTKVTNKYVYINDPVFGHRTMNIINFSKHFTGIALEIWPKIDFKSKKETNTRISLKDIIRNLAEIKNPVIKIFSLSLLIETVALFLPLGNQILMDHVIKSNDISLLIMICSILFFSNIFTSILSIIRQWITIKMNTMIGIQWQISFFTRLLKIPLDFFEKRHLGDIKSRFDSLNNIYNTIVSSINTFSIKLIILISVTIVMFIYNIYLFLLVVLFSLIYIFIRTITYIKFKQINEELIYTKAKVDSHFMETLYSIHTIKASNLNNIRKEHWISLLINFTNTSIKNTKYSSFFTGIEAFIATLDEIIILGIGMYMIMNSIITLGMFIAFSAYRAVLQKIFLLLLMI